MNKERKELALFTSLVALIESKIIVEIGVAYGESTLALCEGASKTGGHVYGFDVWDRHGLQKQFRPFSSMDEVEQKLKSAGYANFTLTKIDTIHQNQEFNNLLNKLCNPIDFAFIDGDHSYTGIQNDFNAIYPLLSPTGIIAFHDTLRIDGCREFVFDLRTKYNDGTYDIVDFPFGNGRLRCGITLLVKRSFSKVGLSITEICGSPSLPEQIEQNEKEWLHTQTGGGEINCASS